jgi:hypothetical protein
LFIDVNFEGILDLIEVLEISSDVEYSSIRVIGSKI